MLGLADVAEREGLRKALVARSWEADHQGAHRVYYERVHGPIPDGLDLDHLCNQRDCVNPEHMESVTRSVNCLRREARKRAR